MGYAATILNNCYTLQYIEYVSCSLSSNNRNVHPVVIDVLQRDISGQIKEIISRMFQ